MSDIIIRQGGEEDVPAILALLDGAVEWLVANGREGQWGTEPWSARPKAVERVRELARTGTPWIAEIDGAPASTRSPSGSRARTTCLRQTSPRSSSTCW